MKLTDETVILIADDESSVRKALERSLKAEGFTNVHLAEDGAEALQVMAKKKVDIVISDYAMPKLNGIELLMAIRRHAQYAKVPFFLMSGRMNNILEERATALGATGCLCKPVSLDDLLLRLSESLDSD